MSRFRNSDHFAPWNAPMHKDDHFAPWNAPMGTSYDAEMYCERNNINKQDMFPEGRW